MSATIDWTDPCQRAETLRRAYYRLVSGQQESEVEYQANGVTRRVRYSQADLSRLFDETRAAEAECAVAQGLATALRVRSIRFNPTKGV